MTLILTGTSSLAARQATEEKCLSLPSRCWEGWEPGHWSDWGAAQGSDSPDLLAPVSATGTSIRSLPQGLRARGLCPHGTLLSRGTTAQSTHCRVLPEPLDPILPWACGGMFCTKYGREGHRCFNPQRRAATDHGSSWKFSSWRFPDLHSNKEGEGPCTWPGNCWLCLLEKNLEP